MTENVLTVWFTPKNVDNTVIFVTIFITSTNQVRSITDNIVPLQSGSLFYKPERNISTDINLHWMIV